MDNNRITQEKKEHLAEEILKVLIKLLEDKSISDTEGEELARFAMQKIEKLTSVFEIPNFYNSLSQKWPAFKPHHKIELGKVDRMEEKEVAKGVHLLISEGKLDKALALARSETHEK